MTNVLFPMGALTGAVNISLETLSALAPQVAGLLLENSSPPDAAVELYNLLERVDIPPPKSRESVAAHFSESFAGHPAVAFQLNGLLEGVGIPLPLRSDAVKQLAIGFSLFRAFEGFRGDHPFLEIEQIERGARDAYMAGYLLDLAVGGPGDVTTEHDLILQASSSWESFERLITNLEDSVEREGFDPIFEEITELLFENFGEDSRIPALLDRIIAAALKIKEPGGRSLALKCIAGHLIDAGRKDRIEEVLGEASASAFRITEDLEGRGDDLTSIAYYWIDLGRPERAREIAEKLVSCARGEGLQADVAERQDYDFEIAAHILAKSGFVDRAREIFEEAIVAARQISDRNDRHRAQESLAESLERDGFSDLAEKVRAEIIPENKRR